MFEVKEGHARFLVKDWKLLKGSKVKPYQPINICKVVEELAPLPKIEKTCEDNYGYGTLGCFAKNKTGEPFAITAQHVLCKINLEKNKNRYIFSEVLKQEQGEQNEECKHTVMLSTCSSGLLKVKCIRQKDILLDIAMMKLSESLINEHKVQITEKLDVARVKINEKVFKIGAETGKTTGTVTKASARLYNEFLEDIKVGEVFCVEGDASDSPFAKCGDSGSLVYTMRGDKKYAIGIVSTAILLAESSQTEMCCCVHLYYCMEALKTLGSKLILYDEATSENVATNGVSLLSHTDVRHDQCPYDMK